MIDAGFSEIEAQTKSELLNRLREIDPFYFEKVILILLKKMGYGDFTETSKSGDAGIDGIINEDKLVWRRYTYRRSVTPTTRCEKLIFVTLSVR
jgi:restriction endonuclease Mrr